MANDFNQCNFTGRLSGDPEVRYSKEGVAIANFSIACNYGKKDEEKVEWVRIVAFKQLAEICGSYLQKGSQVLVSGRMQTRKWEKDGVANFITEIIANQVQFLGAKSDKPKGQTEEPIPAGVPEEEDDVPW